MKEFEITGSNEDGDMWMDVVEAYSPRGAVKQVSRVFPSIQDASIASQEESWEAWKIGSEWEIVQTGRKR